MGGGTEAFPELGSHCQHSDCRQLDFLPFNCNACSKVLSLIPSFFLSLLIRSDWLNKNWRTQIEAISLCFPSFSLQVFCLEHRSYKSHECPKSDVDSRKVSVCEICSTAIETTGHDGEDEKKILERHEKSGDCDPKKKKKPRCPVRRCKEVLTFSNTASCKTCQIKICLKHRFPADHACENLRSSFSSSSSVATAAANKFLVAMAARSGKDCGNKIYAPSSQPSIKACWWFWFPFCDIIETIFLPSFFFFFFWDLAMDWSSFTWSSSVKIYDVAIRIRFNG